MSEAGHNGQVEKMTQEEYQGYLAARYQDHLASGRFNTTDPDTGLLVPDEAAIIAKVNEEAESLDGDGPWLTYCSCGWAGNNPYPTREGALSSLTKHYVQHGMSEVEA